jgi:hypothetical protein
MTARRAVPNEHRVLIATAVKVKGGVLAFAGQSRALFVSRDDGVSVIPWPTSFTSAVAELILLPDGTVLALGESGAAILPSP